MSGKNVVDLGKQAYWSKKRARAKRQYNVIDQVMSLPNVEAAELLFSTWPEHLPKKARGRIDPQVRAHWEFLRTRERMAKRYPRQLAELEQEHISNHLSYLADEAMGRHEKRVDALIEAMSGSVRGQATFSVGINAPIPGVTHAQVMEAAEDEDQIPGDLTFDIDFHGHYTRDNGAAAFTDCEGHRIDYQVRAWMALAMDMFGGMSITEVMSLKRMIKDEHGNETWVPQMKSYAVAMSFGDWFPATAQEAADAYNYDAETGERLPVEQGRSFGTIKKPCWLGKIEPNTEHLDMDVR